MNSKLSLNGRSLVLGILLGGLAVFGIGAATTATGLPKEYRMISARVAEMESMVKPLLAEGWQLYGSPAIDDSYRCIQAVVKY